MLRGLNKIAEFNGLGYVMSSYTVHAGGFDEAHNNALHIAGDLISAGLVVFVPIAYGHVIEPYISEYALDEKYIKSHEFWMTVDERFWRRCDYGILAMTSNWWKSEGIAAELYAMSRATKPIYFLVPEEGHIYTYAEARQKFPDKVTELEKLASEGKHSSSLHEITARYPEVVKQALEMRTISHVFNAAAIHVKPEAERVN